MLWDNEIMPVMDSLVGHQLANYQIKRLVRRGGMASVYYGIDLQLQRPAAIKVIDDRYRGNSAYAERFVREARAMASWRHPNIPQIYQAVEKTIIISMRWSISGWTWKSCSGAMNRRMSCYPGRRPTHWASDTRCAGLCA
jgi:hypothetical protein